MCKISEPLYNIYNIIDDELKEGNISFEVYNKICYELHKINREYDK